MGTIQVIQEAFQSIAPLREFLLLLQVLLLVKGKRGRWEKMQTTQKRKAYSNSKEKFFKMFRYGKCTYMAGGAIVLALIASLLSGLGGNSLATHTTLAASPGPAFHAYSDFARTVAAHHKAPFLGGALISRSQAQAFVRHMQRSHVLHPLNTSSTNTKVNQDSNIWPKAGIAAASNPSASGNYLIMSNDFRQNLDHEYYHVTRDGGRTWIDDAMAEGINTYDFQSDPGVAFDSYGNSFISTLSGNSVSNADTEVDVARGFADGAYTSILPYQIDYAPCSGIIGTSACPATLDKPFVTVDNVKGSPSRGYVYVYYTYFCHLTMTNCTDGTQAIPANSSVILEAHSSDSGLTFSRPALVSGTLMNAQFADMVIDSHGIPHIFFDDFSHAPTIDMDESSYIGGIWTASSKPVVSFQYSGLNNPNWLFRDFGTVAPGCGIYMDTAYCAFSATRVNIGTNPVASPTPSVYLAAIPALNAGVPLARISRVNNDPLNDNKDHFFPWASTDSQGNIYVGWYDNRHDWTNVNVQYYVGESSDGGRSFKQMPVSDVAFNPCSGTPVCLFFGDYDVLVTDSHNVTHATWADTRDGTMQIYTRALTASDIH